jgi:linoleoyl-CoA desaturase
MAMREIAKVTFASKTTSGFIDEVKRRVEEYFVSNGISPKAGPSMVAKTLIMLTVTFGAYGLILSQIVPPWGMLGLAVLMGIGIAGIGFGIAHDALHGAYSSRGWVNRILGYSFDLMGANGYMWKLTHNIIHHTYPNIHGIDDDLEASPLLRLSPEAELKPIHRYQHLYGFAAYSLSTLNWVFVKDYRQFLKRPLGPFQNPAHPASEVLSMIGMKLFYYGYTIVIPLLVLDIPWWQFLIGYLAMHLTAGTILGVVFQLAHIVEPTDHPVPDEEGRIGAAWMIHQMETTANFGGSNRLLSWYVGGLNYQVEHHLFPKVCSVHYPKISSIVRQVAAEHSVPYHAHDTLWAAVRSHYRTLKWLGQPGLAGQTLVSSACD